MPEKNQAPATDAYEWEDQIAKQLARLRGPHKAKKEITLIELVAARIEGRAERTVWERPGTCARTTYYRTTTRTDGTRRGWKYDPLFQDVLAKSLEIAQDWQRRNHLRVWAQRQKQWEEQLYTVALRIVERVDEMLQFPLQRVVTETDQDDQPVQTIIQPARWSVNTVPRLLATADRLIKPLFERQPEAHEGDVVVLERTPELDMFLELQDLDEEELDAIIANFTVGEDAGRSDPAPQDA